MSLYNNILVALECGKDAKQVLTKAAALAAANGDAKIHLVHVVLDLIVADWAGSPGQIPPPLDQEALAQSGADYLRPFIEDAGLDPNDLIMCFGPPAQQILKRTSKLT